MELIYKRLRVRKKQKMEINFSLQLMTINKILKNFQKKTKGQL